MAMANPLDTPLMQQPSGKDGKILVVVQLAGGNDGLNTVVPYADDAYHRVRPGIGHDPKTLHKMNDYVGLHPNLAPAEGPLRRGQHGHRAGRRLSEPQPLALPLDGHLAQRRAGTRAGRQRLARPLLRQHLQRRDPHVGVTIGDSCRWRCRASA